jgi:hypothetical protein
MISVEIKGNLKETIRGIEGLLDQIPLSVWDPVIEDLKGELQAKAREIKKKRVSSVTVKWRKTMSGRPVATHSGETDPVLAPSYLAGMRTGTLLKDIELAREPWIVFDVARAEGGSSLLFALNSDLYSRGYPEYFSIWLERKRGLSEGLSLHEADVEAAADILESQVGNWIVNEWGS